MRIFTIILLITVLTFGCKPHVSKDFEKIDFSYWGTHPKRFGIKIHNDGKTYLSIENGWTHVKTNYVLNLNKKEMDTISYLIRKILVNKYDSIYESGCDQCLTYCLILNTKHKKFKVSIFGDLCSNSFIKPINLFAIQMRNLVKKFETNADSTFIYESEKYLILFPPPPPPDSIIEIMNN